MEPLVLPNHLPLLPLVNQVLLPTAVARVQVLNKDKRNVTLFEHLSSLDNKDTILAVLPILVSAEEEGHDPEDKILRRNDKQNLVGTAARILQVSRNLKSGHWTVVLEGLCRIQVGAVSSSSHKGIEQYHVASINQLELKPHSLGNGNKQDSEVQELGKQLRETTRQVLSILSRHAGLSSSKRMTELMDSVPAWRAADMVAAVMATSLQEKMAALMAVDHRARISHAVRLASATLAALKRGIASRLAGGGRDLSLSSMKNASGKRNDGVVSRLQDQGDADDLDDDLDMLLRRLQAAQPPAEVLRVAQREVRRLETSGEGGAGAAAARAYLETLADLPWKRLSEDLAKTADSGPEGETSPVTGSRAHARGVALSLKEARALLDQAHYGLEKVKERVIEYLAVLRLRGSGARSPILCFIGPPGVGKTSLARSVADVLGRPFVRISLGGVRDEAEIRGHRRTYVGALPGRIIQGIRRAGVRDPVLLLDEVDKVGHDAVRGDPAAALLEVLDPEQNEGFVDTYLGVPFDLSRVTFVATANRASEIPPPLLDRMEVIQLSGYTIEEKVHIAKNHLIPKLLLEHGLSGSTITFSPGVLDHVVERYTREAGVRGLGRALAAVCRHVAVDIVSEGENTVEAHEPYVDEEPEMHADDGDGTVGDLRSASNRVGDLDRALDPDLPAQIVVPPVREDIYYGSGDMYLSSKAESGGKRRGGTGSAPAADSETQSSSGREPVQTRLSQIAAAFRLPSMYFQHSHRQLDAILRPKAEIVEESIAGLQPISSSASRQLPSTQQGLLPCSLSLIPSSVQSLAPPSHLSSPPPPKSTPRQPLNSNIPPDTPSTSYARPNSKHPQQRAANKVHYTTGRQARPYPPDLLEHPARPFPAVTVDSMLVESVLGPPQYPASDERELVSTPGAAAGLVVTSAGGMVQYVECVCTSRGQPGRPGTLMLTGQVGEVLEESAQIAMSWLKAHAWALGLENGIDPFRPAPGEDGSPLRAHTAALRRRQGGNSPHAVDDDNISLVDLILAANAMPESAAPAEKTSSHAVMLSSPVSCWDIHVHLPAGAIPKDGPSAGITLAVALLSLLSGRVVRSDTAMTGELTLRGLVLPVGGIKEKLIAAQRAGLTRVILPARNMRDVEADVPASVKSKLKIIPAERLEDVLQAAFDPPYILRPQSKL